MIKADRTSGHIDWILLLAAAGLMLFSVAFVYSASSSFADVRLGSSDRLFWSHAMRVVVGLVVVLVFAKIDYRIWRKFSRVGIVGALLLLLYVLIAGEARNGATRWISLGFFSFQPSELAKFALITHLAAMIAAKETYLRSFKRALLPMLVWIGAVCILIGLQPNMSTAAVIFTIGMTVLFVGGLSIWQLGGIALLGIGSLVVFAQSAEYRMQRLMAYWGDGENYQLDQALLAFGNGGIFGLGPGQSRQRDWFLPESYGDFIFSIVGEEYGFLGAGLILTAFCLIVWRGLRSAKWAPDTFGHVLATGITITLGAYALINAGVTCGVLPTTGLPMPFISYGGTATIISAAALGVLLNISAQAGVYPGPQTQAAAVANYDVQSRAAH